MKILVLLPDSPDPWTNAAARYYAPMLKQLVASGDDVTMMAVRRLEDAEDELAYFRGTSLNVRLFDLPTDKPFLERKLRSIWRSGWELASSEYGAAVRREAEKDYDVILGEMPETARIVETDPRTVLSLHHLRFEDLALVQRKGTLREKIQWMQAKRAELSTCRAVRTVRTTSSRLKELMRRYGIASRVSVVPLCLDLGLYEQQQPPPVPTVGVIGKMYWWPNRTSALHLLEVLAPEIRRRRPGVRFLIAGQRAQEFIGPSVRHDDTVILDNFSAPEDAFGRLSVLVYTPDRGTGMKVKVLEAMAYGVPAVVNSEGFEGLDADPNAPVRFGADDHEIVDHVVRILDDPGLRRRLAQEGIECMTRSFSPGIVGASLRQVLAERTTSQQTE